MEFYYHELDHEVLILSADGGIDHATSRQFVDGLLKLIAAGVRKIIVDCSKLTYISTYGVGVLLRLHKRARAAGGEVKLACVHSRIVSLLHLLRLDRIFGVYPDVNAARLAFRPAETPPAPRGD